MRRLRQCLSMLLAVAMLLTALPFTTLAADEVNGKAPASVSYWSETLKKFIPIFETESDAQAAGATDHALYTELDEEERQDFAGAGWLFLIEIGQDEYAKAEKTGSYQQKFLVNGVEETLVFAESKYGLSLVIGDRFFLLANDSTAPYSLKPLTTASNTVYLTPEGISTTESSDMMMTEEIEAALGNVKISELIKSTDLASYKDAGKTAVAWKGKYDSTDKYQLVTGGLDGTVDLADLYASGSFNLELIIGASNEVLTTSTDCIRYYVYIDINPLSWLDLSEIFTLSVAKKGTSEAITLLDTHGYWGVESSGSGWLDATLYRKDSDTEATYLAALAAAEGSGYTVEEIYEGRYRSADEITEADPAAVSVKEKLLDADVTASGGMEISLEDSVCLTAVLTYRDITLYVPFNMGLFAADKWVSVDELYYPNSSGSYSSYYYKYLSLRFDPETNKYYSQATLPYGTAADSQCFVTLTFYDDEETGNAGGTHGINYVSAAYEGYYETKAAAEAAGAADIKDKLFVSVSGTVDTTTVHLSSKFAQGTQFTVIGTDDVVYYTNVIETVMGTEYDATAGNPYKPLSTDTYFEVKGVRDSGIDSDYLRYNDDSYYYNGYQTLFILNRDGTAIADGTTIHPSFSKHDSSIYMSKGTESADRIEDLTACTVTLNGTVTQEHYSANAENGENLKNYWISYVTQSAGGAKLFVNGVSNAADSHRTADGGYQRVVVLDDEHGNYHDIFIANIGDAELTDLKVTLSEDATGVALDEYWNGGDGKIDAFTSIGSGSSYQNFITKVRLVPQYDENGNPEKISGTLTISGAGETYTIELVGYAQFAIETATLKDAVKYVVYDQLIQTNSMADSDAVEFELNYDGTDSLPAALKLSKTGVLYGIPQAAGEYNVRVKATQDLSDVLSELATGLDALQDYKYLVNGKQTAEAEFTLTVQDNTDHNVWGWGETGLVDGTPDHDEEYKITQAIPNQDGTTTNIADGDETSPLFAPTEGEAGVNDWSNSVLYLVTLGEYARFRELYLDGEKLTANVDYKYDPGSTILTVYKQSLASTSVGTGTHTLSAAFYTTSMDDQTLRHASQNYTVTTPIRNTAGGSSGGGSSTANPGGSTTSQSTPTQETDNSGWPLKDVPLTSTEWYLDDVKWAYENGYMTGTSATMFSPAMSITQPMIVTTLARLEAVDLDSIAYVEYEGIPEGAWYTAAAIWAKEAGMLPGSVFSEYIPTSREDMAIMLVKYLNRVGIDCTVPDDIVVFKDADQMSEAGMAAFQVLYKYGIFKGVGNGYMDPKGKTTRAQYAALLHRLVALLSA